LLCFQHKVLMIYQWWTPDICQKMNEPTDYITCYNITKCKTIYQITPLHTVFRKADVYSFVKTKLFINIFIKLINFLTPNWFNQVHIFTTYFNKINFTIILLFMTCSLKCPISLSVHSWEFGNPSTGIVILPVTKFPVNIHSFLQCLVGYCLLGVNYTRRFCLLLASYEMITQLCPSLALQSDSNLNIVKLI
jgi:hypothetical protein